LPVSRLDGGTAASTSTFWRGDGHWVSPTGAGDVQEPGSSTDGAVALFNGATGKALKTFSGATGFRRLDTVGVVTRAGADGCERSGTDGDQWTDGEDHAG
jgi:hypothetical protein